MIALVVVFGFLFWVGDGLNFKCGNNQLLFVSDFGQNTVRMHCHGMDVCSALNKGKCGYFEGGHSCKDKLAFVSSVSQRSDSEGVFHDCCVIGDNKLDSGVLADYFEKDCFIYNMPDIGNGSIIGENGEVKRINYGFDLDKPKESVIDQRNSKMIVKSIRRYTKGYSISICRAHCNRNSLNTVMKKEQIRIDENELMEIARAIKTATNSLRESVIPILERPLRLLSLRSSRIQKYLKMKDTIKSQVKLLAPKTVRNPIAHKPTTHAPITHKSTIHPPIIHKLKIEGDAHPTVIDINTTTQSSRLSMKLLTAQLNERYKVMSQFPSMNHKAFGVRMSQPLADPISFDSSRTTLSPDSLFGIPIDDFIRFINERKKSMKKTTSTTTTTTIATTTAEDPRVFSKELLLEWLKERANFVAPSSSTTTAAPVQIETSKIFSDLRREILMSLLNEMNSKTSTAVASLILTTMPPKIVVGGETAKKVIDTSLDFDSEKDSKESTESEETTEVTKKVNIVVEPELDPNTNRPKNHAIPELFKLRLPRINSTTARPKLTPLPPKKVVLTTRRPKSLIEARITTRTPIPTTTTKLKLTTRPHFSFPDYTLVDDNLDPAHSRINLNSLSSKPSKSVRKKDELSKSKDGLAKVQAALQSVLQSIPLFAFKPKKDEIVSSFNTDKVIKTPDIIKLFNYSSPDYISSSTELA
uniref:Wsv203 n=1 Tax=Rhabditophanes sp. KR3021 TaxID=114890 RepID=A0AC35TPW3_9BILA